jgi:two-component system alkaline phosphatase synthesis response regulator PhoP
VDVHIRHLRSKIEENGDGKKYIETVRGVGYKIK